MFAIDPNETIEFVLPEERGKDDATVFLLAPLTSLQFRSYVDRGAAQENGTLQDEMLLCGLRGLRGFRGRGGEEITFQPGEPVQALGGKVERPPARRLLDRLPASARVQIALRVMTLSLTGSNEDLAADAASSVA